ncbi:Ig-like domain-containing protein [Microbacterium sp.]|uniref:Ig-like domain-containing protein n=1 Tax=Microbacterium sp. TaxID=51671 RepID=UPI003F719A6F
MRSAHKLGLVAGVAGALVLAPLPALAAEDDSDATGTLTVTRFDDRYADGLFDPSNTNAAGYSDAKNDSAPRVLGADGVWYHASPNADGDVVFENLPVGEAQVHFLYPNSPGGEVFFDATGATSAADIEQLPVGSFLGSQSGYATVDIDADGEFLLVGMTALRLVTKVQLADGTPVEDLASVELGSRGTWNPATEYDFAGGYGTYEAFSSYGYVRHLPGDLSVRLAPPAGYRVASVTAQNYEGGPSIPVTKQGDSWSFASTEVQDYFWNPFFTVTLEEAPDTVKPVATLVSPTTAGPFQSLSLQVDATDDRGLDRVVANIYKDGKLVKSTQTAANGASSATHTATVSLPDGAYTVKYNASDLAGNIAQTGTFAFSIDKTAPTITVKDGASYTNGAGGIYGLVSFKLHDAGKIDRITLNGKVKDLTDNAWSDLNFVKPGVFGAVEGANTLVAYDVAGNTTTLQFALDATGPTVTVKGGSTLSAQSFKLYDANKVDKVTINGVVKDLSNNVWSDVNGVKNGVFGAVSGANTLVAYDVFGNTTTVAFTLD